MDKGQASGSSKLITNGINSLMGILQKQSRVFWVLSITGLFYYNVLLALIRDMVGSSSLAPKGLYKVLWYNDFIKSNMY